MTKDSQSGTAESERDIQAGFDALVAKFDSLTDEVSELKEGRLNSDKLFDVKALAERWCVCERTVHSVVAEGYIVPTYIKTALRFTWASIEAYERNNTGWDKRRRTHKPVIRKEFNHFTGQWEKPRR